MTKNTAIIGAQFGDEAKGRITYTFSPQFDWVVRYNGSCNSGHTIYDKGSKIVRNLLPSANFSVPNTKCFLSKNMVINLPHIYAEILTENKRLSELTNQQVNIANKVYIDPEAFVIFPKHIEEDIRINANIGTTKRGVGPAYTEKIARNGTRIDDILNTDEVRQLQDLGVNFNYHQEVFDTTGTCAILFEGAQAVLLDINHGLYPYVSCSDTTISGIYSSGFYNIHLNKVYGVAKCYSTKVGAGVYPTEIFGDEAEKIRQLGKEFGATTGRERRIGWLDLPALRYAIKHSGINTLIISKLDILNGLDKIKVCTEYDGIRTPVSSKQFFNAKPKYIELQGWKDAKDINQIKPFIDFVQNEIGLIVEYVSCGVDEQDLIKIQSSS